jgi:hypothetical protein
VEQLPQLASVTALEPAPRRIAPPLGLVEPPPPGVKARQLYEEARLASLEHLRALDAAIATVRDLSDAIVEGGELYAPGLRDLARRLSEDLSWKAKTLQKLSQRQRDLVRTA